MCLPPQKQLIWGPGEREDGFKASSLHLVSRWNNSFRERSDLRPLSGADLWAVWANKVCFSIVTCICAARRRQLFAGIIQKAL